MWQVDRGSGRCRASSTRASTARRRIASSPASSMCSRCARRSSDFRRNGIAIRRPAASRRYVRQGARLSRRADRRRHQVSVGAEPTRGAGDARAGVASDAATGVTRRAAVRCWIRGSSSVRIARGPHWTSSLEQAMRLMNWSFAWHLLGGRAHVFDADARGVPRWLVDLISTAISSPATSRAIRRRTITCSAS